MLQRNLIYPYPISRVASLILKINRPSLFVYFGLIGFLLVACQTTSGFASSGLEFKSTTCLRPICEEVTVKRGDVNLSVALDGVLRYSNDIDLSFDTIGTIASVDVVVGDKVEKGQIVASLDTSSLKIAAFHAKAALEEFEMALEEALRPADPDEIANARSAVVAADVLVFRAQEKIKMAQRGPSVQEFAQAKLELISAEVLVEEAEEALRVVKADPSDLEFAESASKVAAAKQKIRIAEENLANLVDEFDPLILRELGAKADLAKINLSVKQVKLEELRAGPDLEKVDEARRNYDAALIADLRSQLARQRLDEDADSDTVEFWLLKLLDEKAESDLEKAERKLELTLAGPTAIELLEAEAAVIAAEILMSISTAKIEALKAGSSEEEIAVAEAAVEDAELEVAAAQLESKKLNGGISQQALIQKGKLLEIAVAGADLYRSLLTDLESGPDIVMVNEKQKALDAARNELDFAVENLALLIDRSGKVELLRLQVESARSKLAKAEANLEGSVLTALFTGTISAVNMEPGQDLNKVRGSVRLVDTDTLDVKAVVNDVGLLRVGQETLVTVKASENVELTGYVKEISSSAGNAIRDSSSEVIVSFRSEIASAGLREGITVGVEVFIDRRTDVLYVPVAALRYDGQQASFSVDVVNDGIIRSIPVTSSLNDGLVAEVVGSLVENDIVRILRSGTGLRDP